MGQMHFHVPDAAAEFFHASRWQDAYLCGIEGVPWQTRNVFHPHESVGLGPVTAAHDLPTEFVTGRHPGGRLTFNRSVNTSAKLLITCPIDGIGYRVLTTCSLRCVDTPHELLIELARGTCYRVRTQSDTWQRGGLILNEQFTRLLDDGTHAFLNALQPTSAAIADAEVETTKAATQAIALLEQASVELSALFAAQSMTFRRTREPRLSTMLAVGMLPFNQTQTKQTQAIATKQTASRAATAKNTATLDNVGLDLNEPCVAISDTLTGAFNAAAVRMSWGDIENAAGTPDFTSVNSLLDRCATVGLRVIGGPVIDHRIGLLPDWLMLLNNDFEHLMSAMTKFVEATVNEFRGRVHLWNAAAGLNLSGPLGLDDGQVMRFSLGVVQTIRRCDPHTPVIISIDQPCGEYLAKHADGISPIHFADALLRSGLGLAGIGLNFRFGFDSGETQPRTPLEFAQLIDRWGTLNAPLLVQLSVPAAPGTDTAAIIKHASVPLMPFLDNKVQSWAQQQHDFARPLIETLLAKQIVHAVVWDGASDETPHVMPHTGVIDSSGKPRPMLAYLTRLRDEWLM